jgi:bifunctional enzyme CysN/CysC
VGRSSCGGEKDLLHFLTCGSVDDGKSTLVGRLLYDCSLILDDQLATLRRRRLVPAAGRSPR